MNAILYHTLGCHLCGLAEVEIAKYNQISTEQFQLNLQKIDIISDAKLVDAYGTKIPVLFIESVQLSINWPFSCSEIQSLLAINIG